MKDIKVITGIIFKLIEAENGPKGTEKERVEAKDVKSFLSENFEFTGGKDIEGQVKNKAAWLKDIPRPSVYREIHDLLDIVPESDDIAVIKSIVTTTKTAPDSNLLPDKYRNIHVFVNENGDWRCNYWQVTKLVTIA